MRGAGKGGGSRSNLGGGGVGTLSQFLSLEGGCNKLKSMRFFFKKLNLTPHPFYN